jgi:tubulin-specific chaperone E
MDLPAIGTRISVAGSLGTIKFAGNVDNTKGAWLGVEWDDPSRGKHSGAKDGKQYFECRCVSVATTEVVFIVLSFSIPKAGSFIRPPGPICYGISFLQALRTKYIEMQHGTASQEKVLLGSSNGAIEVEAVGLDKIRGKFAQLDRLRDISVDDENVATADSPGEVHNTCPSMYSYSSSRC